jgi:hypothetical protein
MMFRNDLTEEEKQAFRQWARDNYKVYEPIKGIWHIIVQEECVKMNAETDYYPEVADPSADPLGDYRLFHKD